MTGMPSPRKPIGRAARVAAAGALLVLMSACSWLPWRSKTPKAVPPAAPTFSAPSPTAAMPPQGVALTAFGAEADGDSSGIIPSYKGGLQTVPANYKDGSSLRPDPFHWEKPLFSIDAHNEGDFDDMLTTGAKALIASRPGFRIEVYPTHRSAVFPQAVLENTAANAQRCTTAADGVVLAGAGCSGGLPFPVPKTGAEAMWDHLLAWRGIAVSGRERDWFVDHSGAALLETRSVYDAMPWYDDGYAAEIPYRQTQTTIEAPVRGAGARSLEFDYLNPLRHPQTVWQYEPGQRGVRLAPDHTHDLAADSGDASFFDDAELFSGALDRFSFRLVGKKEMIIPYNDYRQLYRCGPDQDLMPAYLNPACIRWELHRVWVVEATRKKGRSHAYGRRVFYWDEDTWTAGAADEFDARGHLYRAGFVHPVVWYESQINSSRQYVIYDFRKHAYALYGEAAANDGPQAVDPLPVLELTPDMLAGTSVR